MHTAKLPPSVNFHLLNACNYRCGFCFAVFDDSAEYLGKGQLPLEAQLEIVRQLAAAGVEKITFAGGEPTLSANLPKLLAESKRLGMTTMIVTNGTRLRATADRLFPHLDWLVLSVDSGSEQTNIASGRAQKGVPLTASEYIEIADLARTHGIRVKLNTVVHQLNVDEEMTDFVARLAPERWKVFQVLPVEDQNGAQIDRFRITAEQFEGWLIRHRAVETVGVVLVPEANDAMRGTYAMIDPAGRFYDSSAGHHTYSEPILAVGVETAFAQVSFATDRYVERGGVYDWADSDMPEFVALAGVSGSGKDTVAEALVADHGYRRVAIADPIKRACQELFDLTDEQLWGDQRNEAVARWGDSPRGLYQRLGSAMHRIDPEIWIRSWRAEVKRVLESGQRVVCTDIRTPDELETARALGAQTVLLQRPTAGAPGALAEHETERAVSRLRSAQFDATVNNDGTIAELIANVVAAAKGGR